MSPDLLTKYLGTIEIRIQQLANVYIERYEEEIITPNRANLRLRVRVIDGHLLELNEAVVEKSNTIEHLYYRYHFQNDKNELIFRYDNAPHFQGLSNFPHHKHLPDDTISVSKPSIHKVIEEAGQNIIQTNE